MREAYGFLCHNYHPGDTIHLFGFSRGAYTARCICGLICRLGLLTKLGMDNFYTVYQDYQTGKMTDQYIADLHSRENGGLCRSNIVVTTIGCFDTVGSLGIPTLPIPVIGRALSGVVDVEKFSFHDTDLSPRVLHAFHALGLDEQRQPFFPTLWFKPPSNTTTELRQCWFPGVHTNVGGGYEDQEIADMTLAWMIERTKKWLDWNPLYLQHIIKNGGNDRKEWAEGKIYDSRTGIMRLAGRHVRTPGGYPDTPKNPNSDTAEFMHVSVRVRRQLLPEWHCDALQGWQWTPEQKCWVNKDSSKRLKEDWLGDTEMELAGRDIVTRLLQWAFPGNVDGAQLSPDSGTGE